MSRAHATGLCGPDCRYRNLYEGSQSSLSDMAANQATALMRVGRLRAGMVSSLKQTFPVEFGDAERQLGQRMSTIDDEILLAYLGGFLAMPKAQTATRVAAGETSAWGPLRAALEHAGISLPVEDDPELWAGAVTKWAEHRTPPQVRVTAPVEPGTAPLVEVSGARLPAGGSRTAFPAEPIDDGAGANVLPADLPADDDDSVWGPGLEDLFGEEAPPTLEELHGVPDTDYFPARPQPVAEPAAAQSEPVTAPWGHTADPTGDQSGDQSGAPSSDPSSDTSSDPSGMDYSGWGALFDDDPQVPAPDAAPDAAPAAPPAAPPAAAPAAAPDAAPDAAPSSAQLADTAASPQPSHTAKKAAAEPTSTSAKSSPEGARPTTVSTRTSGPIKPELFPQAPTKKSTSRSRKSPARREPRVTASAPAGDPRTALTAAAAAGELTDELREKLLATVCMSRPVFMADLVHLVGNPDLVDAWEKECRQQGTASPIRFISAKPRHAARGHLVIPYSTELRTSTSEFEKSLWSQCINNANLKGAKLYELAVLLHRVLDSVVTFDIGEEIVTMRVNQPRGLVGVIMVLNNDIDEGSETRAELAGALSAMAAGRLSLLVVCSYAGGPRVIPELAEAARIDLEDTNTSVSFPVIAQASWEFASDGGTSAISVLS